MASDKKSGIPVTARKPQGSNSRKPMKQRTLFDSFLVKPAANVAPDSHPLVPSPHVNLPLATLNAPSDKQENTTPQVIGEVSPVDDPLVEDYSEKPFMESNSSFVGVPLGRERSPSVVLVEEISEISLKPSKHATKEPLTLPLGDSKADGKSVGQPIVIASSPIEGPATTYPRIDKPVHPFFQPKLKATGPLVPQASSKQSSTVHRAHVAPYPSIQHTRGPQTFALNTPLTMFPKRTAPRQAPHLHNSASYKFLNRSTNVENELGNPWTYFAPDKPSPTGHELNNPLSPAVILNGPPTSRRPWSEKWRPSCAEKVLGNEDCAVYLRNWLRALELQLEDNTTLTTGASVGTVTGKAKPSGRGTKRARVVRTVDKTRRKKSRLDSDEEDNWIVHTDDESEDEVEPYSDFDALGEPIPSVPASSPSSSTPHGLDTEPAQCQDLGQLHNTILLSGPHGTGKTASVYACAEELGWDVFEVYPGIGRRNGANVDNLVGEVGKNHLVNVNRQSGDVLKSFLKHKDNPEMELFNAPVYSPRKKASLGVGPETITKDRMRQSLILLEEVDILFKEDTNFWTTVTRIIKECKRPVICTCNDLSLVPTGDLPLQTILHFSPALPEVATPYLQSLCLAEGYSLKAENITQIHLNSWKDSPKDLSIYPPSTGDLRRTINALQVACLTLEVSRPGGTWTTPHDARDGTLTDRHIDNKPRISAKAIEAKSYIDGVLLGEDASQFFATRDLASHFPSEDDEIGHVILRDVHAGDLAQLGLNDRHEEIVWTATQLSRGEFDVGGMISLEERRRRARDGQKVVLHEVCPPGIWSRADGLVGMDYVGYMRQMVLAEDKEEMEQEKRRQGGRNTRNSARSGYVRTLELTEEARRVVCSVDLFT